MFFEKKKTNLEAQLWSQKWRQRAASERLAFGRAHHEGCQADLRKGRRSIYFGLIALSEDRRFDWLRKADWTSGVASEPFVLLSETFALRDF